MHVDPFPYLDKHSGAFVAIATLALVAVTILYVEFTRRLVNAQNSGVYREIIEQIYAPIVGELDQIGKLVLYPSFYDYWPRLKATNPAIAYSRFFRGRSANHSIHFLMPPHLRHNKIMRLSMRGFPERRWNYQIRPMNLLTRRNGFMMFLSIGLMIGTQMALH